MQYDATPLWQRLTKEGRTMTWLARSTGYNRSYLHMMRTGTKPITAEFVEKASAAFDLEPSALFLPADITEVMQSVSEERVAD